MCGRQNNGPQICSYLMLRTCEYVTIGYFPWQRDFTNVTKVMHLEMRRLSRGSSLNTCIFRSEEPFSTSGNQKVAVWETFGPHLLILKMEQECYWPRNEGGSKSLKSQGNWFSSKVSIKKFSLANTLIAVQWDWCWTCDL